MPLENLDFILADLFLMVSGIILGTFMAVTLVSLMFKNVKVSEKIKGTKAAAVKFQDDKTGEEIIFVNPGSSFSTNVILFYKIISFKITKKKYLRIHNSKLDFLLYRAAILLMFILLAYSVFQIVDTPD